MKIFRQFFLPLQIRLLLFLDARFVDDIYIDCVHQGVADPGTLTIAGRAPDHTIEAVEIPGRRFAVGVLWHPEAGDDPRLFEALVLAASE